MNERMNSCHKWHVDRLSVRVLESRQDMGIAAAEVFAEFYRHLKCEHKRINVVFAAAPSQDHLLDALTERRDIDWERIHAFHMDEYVGLADDDPRRFARYLDSHIFGLVPFARIHYIDPGFGDTPEALIERYEKLLEENPIHIVCLGIGENGHIAFNDPCVADFSDPHLMKIVDLDRACRLQQVHDGCFSSLREVPTHALTMTIPALMSAQALLCVVPGPMKKEAVELTLNGPIDPACPASIMRRHENAVLFLDEDSAPTTSNEKCCSER